MSSLVDQPQFNQQVITAKLEQIKKECEENGDEYSKNQIQEFGAQAKKIVSENVKNLTLAYEKEQEILGSLKTKNDQLLKAIQAIDLHKNNFQKQLTSLEAKQKTVEDNLNQARQQVYEKETIFRARRGEQREIQSNFVVDRI